MPCTGLCRHGMKSSPTCGILPGKLSAPCKKLRGNMGKPCRSNFNTTWEILACPRGHNCLTRLLWENSLTLKTAGKNRKAEPHAQGWNTSDLLHPSLSFSQHLCNTVKGLGSLQLLSYLTGKGASSEASLPLRSVFRISTIKKRPQPRSRSNCWTLQPSLACHK